MNCTSCGQKIEADENFCGNCGQANPKRAPAGISQVAPHLEPPAKSATAFSSPSKPSKLSVAALFSLILSLVPVLPIIGQITSIILGRIGLKRISRSNGDLHGRGIAIAGITISSIVLVVMGMIICAVVVVSLHKVTPGPPIVEPIDNHSVPLEAPDSFTNSLTMDFVRIKPGTFQMGSSESEDGRIEDERLHKVNLTRGFYMATTPVTQAQWRTVMAANPSAIAVDAAPVDGITWNESVQFCQKLSQLEGKKYRLPTEAEWEYCCRAGTSTPIPSDDQLHRGELLDGSHFPVKQLRPNAWGIYDMEGNVLEWCSDWYGPYSGDEIDPHGPADGQSRVIRGCQSGIWIDSAFRCARRGARRTEATDFKNIGVRIVVDIE